MKVVVTDRRFPNKDPYTETVSAANGGLVYEDCQNEQDVIDACRDATVVMTFKAPITRDAIKKMQNVRLIIRNVTGYDNVNVGAATEHRIPVSNIPDYCTEEVASHEISLMLSAAHQLIYAHRDLQDQDG